MSIEQNIFDAVDIIVDRAISQAGFDRTINAIVVNCEDEVTGKYKVKYQDSLYYATSDSNVKYTKNSEVYVLVPGGDFSREKKILGTVKSLGANYINSVEGDEGYEYIGANIVSKQTELSLCSFKDEYEVIYDSENEDNSSVLIDTAAMTEYLTKSTHMIVGAQFKTDLVREQRNYGNYGIIFTLEFLDDATKQSTFKDYIVDVDNMIGQPYNFGTYTRQVEEFEINGANFQKIKKIAIFTKGFPKKAEDKPDDIFINNIEINGAVQLNSAALDSYYLSIITPQGTFFPEDTESIKGEDILTLDAEIKIKGKVIDNSLQKTDFYWFREHGGITSSHPLYNKYGGQGWECLNKYNVIEGVTDEEGNIVQEGRVEWIPAEDVYKIKRADCLAKETKYKCVCLYDETITLEKEIIIKNYSAEYDIQINSSNGTKFYYDQGATTLTCLVDKDENLSYNYYWTKQNNTSKNYEPLETTESLNTEYNLATKLKLLLENKLKSETIFRNQTYVSQGSEYAQIEELIKGKIGKDSYTYGEFFDSIVSYLNDKTITRIEKNVLHNLNINTITNFATYVCSVYKPTEKGESFIGSASIKIYNIFEERKSYSLYIHNGTQVFKYNEVGVSPTHESNEKPQMIPTLSFSLFDEEGNQIEEDVIRRNCKVKWIFPATETMLESKIQGTEGTDKFSDEENVIYTNTLIFDFDLLPNYNINRNRNNIELEVTYKDIVVRAKTDFTILKDGDSGTNGTDILCKIVPNIRNDETPPEYPVLYFPPSGNPYMNFNIVGSGDNYGTDAVNYKNWFKVRVWRVEQELVEDITASASVKWSMLANKYSANVSDSSAFSVSESGTFTVGSFTDDHPANIIKAAVTVDGKTTFVTLPVTTVRIKNSNYKASIKEGTGFNSVIYSSSGKNPKYDATNPFEVELLQNKNNTWVDISTSEATKPSYGWSERGRTYKGGWVKSKLLKQIDSDEVGINAKKYRPDTTYDGYAVTNAIVVSVKNSSGTEVAIIHKPIHFLLNRYAFSHLNDWDGNSIKINDTEGYILTPQVGAGRKESDNSFTGILMGAVKDNSATKEETGLFGYASGQRSIFLDAETGKAEFGVEGKSKIILDPTNNKAEIKSGNYSTTNKTGLLIDFTTPEICYGSGLFHVDKDGKMTAKEGYIAGWEITASSLKNAKVGMSSLASDDNTIAFWAGSSSPASADFYVTYGGELKATKAKIGGWSIDGDSIFTGTKTSDASVRLSSVNFSRTINGASRGSLRIALGSKFGVASDGTVYSNSGVFKSATIDSANITNAKISGTLSIQGNSVTWTYKTLKYASKVSITYNMVTGLWWFRGYPSFTSITVDDRTIYGFSSQPNMSSYVFPTDFSTDIDYAEQGFYCFT